MDRPERCGGGSPAWLREPLCGAMTALVETANAARGGLLRSRCSIWPDPGVSPDNADAAAAMTDFPALTLVDAPIRRRKAGAQWFCRAAVPSSCRPTTRTTTQPLVQSASQPGVQPAELAALRELIDTLRDQLEQAHNFAERAGNRGGFGRKTRKNGRAGPGTGGSPCRPGGGG